MSKVWSDRLRDRDFIGNLGDTFIRVLSRVPRQSCRPFLRLFTLFVRDDIPPIVFIALLTSGIRAGYFSENIVPLERRTPRN